MPGRQPVEYSALLHTGEGEGMRLRTVLLATPLVAMTAVGAAVPTPDELLPPLPPVQLKTLDLIAAPDDPWITPAERTGLKLASKDPAPHHRPA